MKFKKWLASTLAAVFVFTLSVPVRRLRGMKLRYIFPKGYPGLQSPARPQGVLNRQKQLT